MKLIIASNNKGKISEFKKLLEPLGYEVLSQREAGIDIEPEENGKTFEENSKIKARAIHALVKNACVLADDSGLAVDYLKGAPGVYSARYGNPEFNDNDRCNYLLENMKNCPDKKRTAHFVCVLHFIFENGTSVSVRGECKGRIGYEPHGENGFGYDPIFYVGEKSFAEIPQEFKNRISHRAVAMNKLYEYLSDKKGY